MKNNKLIIVLIILILCLSFQTSKVVIKNDKKEYSDAKELGISSELYQCLINTYNITDESEITSEALESVQYINCSNIRLSDTKGIEKFTNLGYLVLDNNDISEIDLSHNTNLIALDLHNNNLSKIDVSKLTKLRYLSLSANKLESLDLSKNAELESVYASSNNLKSISFSNLAPIYDLNLVFNQLGNYTIPHKEILEYLTVDYDSLKNLNFSEYSNLQRLTIAYEKTINVLGKNFQIKELKDHLPESVNISSPKLYNTFENVELCNVIEQEWVDGPVPQQEMMDGSITMKSFELTPSDKIPKDSKVVPISPRGMFDYCENNEITADTDLSDVDLSNLQIYSNDIEIDGVNIPDDISVNFTAYYHINYVDENDNDQDNNTEVAEVVKNIPNTGATIINIILFGIMITITGVYIVLNAMNKEKRND